MWRWPAALQATIAAGACAKRRQSTTSPHRSTPLSTHSLAQIRLDDPAKYQSIVDAEWAIIYDKLAKCVASGANIVLSRLAIGDLGTQYFADRGIFCAGRVPDDDLQRVAKATGARVQTTVNSLDPAVLGTCERFEERQVGAGERRRRAGAGARAAGRGCWHE